jgi:hypothetical protein
MDPKMQPRFAHVAMEIARTQSVCFIGANYTASLFRNNFDIHFWCKVLTFLRRLTQKNVSKYGGHPYDLLNYNRSMHLWRMATPSEDLVFHCQVQCSSSHEVPNINIQDMLFGNIKLHGKFEFLSWRSRIPPYYSYVISCEIREPKPLDLVGLATLVPEQEVSMGEWWLRQRRRLDRTARPSFDTLMLLVAWSLWKERNDRTIQRRSRSHLHIFNNVVVEAEDWVAAGLL